MAKAISEQQLREEAEKLYPLPVWEHRKQEEDADSSYDHEAFLLEWERQKGRQEGYIAGYRAAQDKKE